MERRGEVQGRISGRFFRARLELNPEAVEIVKGEKGKTYKGRDDMVAATPEEFCGEEKTGSRLTGSKSTDVTQLAG